MFAARSATPLFTLLRQAPRSAPAPSSFLRFQRSTPRSLCTSTATHTPHATSFLASYRMALAAALPVVALGVGMGSQKPVECASDRSYATSAAPSSVVGGGAPEPAPVESIVNVRDLGFGTVSGICVGVFVKKGLKAVAFALGGVFVLLQYFSSRSLININWANVTNSYDSFITKRAGPPAAQGGNRAAGLVGWFVDFVSADVQSRATFVAGMLLGFRLG